MSRQDEDANGASSVIVRMVPHRETSKQGCLICGFHFVEERVAVLVEWAGRPVGRVCPECVENGREHAVTQLVAQRGLLDVLARGLNRPGDWPTMEEFVALVNIQAEAMVRRGRGWLRGMQGGQGVN